MGYWLPGGGCPAPSGYSLHEPRGHHHVAVGTSHGSSGWWSSLAEGLTAARDSGETFFSSLNTNTWT